MTSGSDVRMAFEDSVDWERLLKLVAVRRRAPLSIDAGMPAKPCT
jgi:hypothetical protein